MPQTKEFLRKLRKKYHLGEFRRQKSKSKSLNTSSHKRRTMARKGKKSYSRNSGNRMLMQVLGLLAPVGYGMVRAKIAQNMPEVKRMENYSDEVLLGGGSFLLGAFMPKAKILTKPIQDVEFARIGEKLANRVPISRNGGTLQERAFVTGATF